MLFRDIVNRYIAISSLCLLLLLILVGFDHFSYDRTHFAQQIENTIQEQETEAVHQLREGDWISQLRSTQKANRILSNDLVKQIEKLGGVRLMFLTHRDDVADHEKWGSHFKAERVMHRDDIGRSLAGIERVMSGHDAVQLDDDLLAIPTPGHTRGHTKSVCWYSWPEQIRSFELLLDYEFKWVLPGHGRRVHLSSSIMREQLEQCLQRMKQLTRVAS